MAVRFMGLEINIYSNWAVLEKILDEKYYWIESYLIMLMYVSQPISILYSEKPDAIIY
jgi:hypothetical protein